MTTAKCVVTARNSSSMMPRLTWGASCSRKYGRDDSNKLGYRQAMNDARDDAEANADPQPMPNSTISTRTWLERFPGTYRTMPPIPQAIPL